jgi:hypothetical protein
MISEKEATKLFFETETAHPGSVQAEMYMVDIQAYANVVAKYVLEQNKKAPLAVIPGGQAMATAKP